jgi:dihydroorotase
VADALGIKGIPNISESLMVIRDIALCEDTLAPVHFCHISTAQSIDAIRQAKKKGLPVTCETAPHYFTLSDEDIREPDPHFKMNPPLRSAGDKAAVLQGLVDGTIDVIATDHAPHSPEEKQGDFHAAAFGIVGLETALPLCLDLVRTHGLSLAGLVDKMSKHPARILGINNDITPGNRADLTLIDPNRCYTIDSDTFVSKGRNTPFAGMPVQGEAALTVVDGQIVYQRQQILE